MLKPNTISSDSGNSQYLLNAFILALSASIFIGFSLYWNLTNLIEEKIKLATFEAEAHWSKDAAMRRWGARHGGVYVKPDKRTPPNPYLEHLKHRDIETVEGTKLTLMNPAYMMAQMTREFEELYGIKGKITGKKLLNPINQADEWELNALTQFEQGVKKVIEEKQINGEPFLRYMKPMYMTEGCVKCHGVLGFKNGDLRGGVSVSVPLKPYYSAAQKTSRAMWFTHLSVWVLAIISIMLFAMLNRARQKERTQLLHKLEHDAFHDSLTQLPNRVLFKDRLEQALKRSQRDSDYRFSVCFLDVDRFKNLNDSYGHAMGDKILIQLAGRFQSILRPEDSVARIGGDEFTFLLGGIDRVTDAVILAERILNSMKMPFKTDAGSMYLDASIGVCLSDATYTNAEDLLRDADIALYRAKESGKGRVDVFNQDMHQHAKDVMQMENDLRHALQKKQIIVYFQPIVDAHDNIIVGFEALVRWQHPEHGFIGPDSFIPVAEDTGQIDAIGLWVMKKACATIYHWNQYFCESEALFLSVNLSSRQLINPMLVENIQMILDEIPLDPKLLKFEVTETAVMQHREQAAKVINKLREIGINVCMDDFGKGYSSLTYLHEFNFDTLKIDKDFIHDMEPSGSGLKLVKTIISMASDFELQVVAEGVEQKDQLEKLQSMGCKLIQGYYYSRPLPEDQVFDLLLQGCQQQASKLVELNSGQ